MSIRTARLVLRRFRAADASALARYRSDPDGARYQSWEAPVTPDAAVALVEAFATGGLERPGWFQYAITLDDRLIGDLGVRREDDLRRAEVGITIDPGHHRRGYATEALTAVVAYLFDHLGLHKVSAECDARNEASATLLRRVGFVEEGRRRAHVDEGRVDRRPALRAARHRSSPTGGRAVKSCGPRRRRGIDGCPEPAGPTRRTARRPSSR